MNFTEFIYGLDSTEKLVIHICYKIVKIRRIGGKLRLYLMPVRLMFMKLLERV